MVELGRFSLFRGEKAEGSGLGRRPGDTLAFEFIRLDWGMEGLATTGEGLSAGEAMDFFGMTLKGPRPEGLRLILIGMGLDRELFIVLRVLVVVGMLLIV